MRGRPRTISKGPHPNNIEELRQKAGLSQEDVARILGISSSAFGKLERWHTRLRLDQLEKLATAFVCTTADLLPGGAAISTKERALLDLFRQLPKSQQDALLGLGSALAEPVKDFLPAHPGDGKKKA